MKKSMVIIFSLFLCVTLYAQNKNSLVSLWEYSAPDAPYGYQSGTIDIKEVEGKLTGEVKIQGSTIRIQEIKKENGQYTCSFYVEGQDMDITMKQPDKNKLEGKAVGGGMDIPFTCKPAKK